MRRPIIILWLVSLAITSLSQQPDVTIKGIYGNPGALLKEGYSFRELGVNAIFVRSVSLDESLVRTAREQHVQVFVEFPTLNGKGYVEHHPEAWPVDETGAKSPAADWFMGVCPTDPGFKAHRVAQLRDILNTYTVDGIWLDYLHWHAQFETPDPILPETCFCRRCVQTFGSDAGIDIPEGDTPAQAQWILTNQDDAWRQWRRDVLTEWVSDLDSEVSSMQPHAMLGIFHCAWYPDDFEGALGRIMGIDLKALSQIADAFSPMLFHRMMDRPVSWVSDYPAWLRTHIGKETRIWPIVQAHNKPGTVTAEEFANVLSNGGAHPSSGVMMFSEQSLLADPAKIEVMKEFYRE